MLGNRPVYWEALAVVFPYVAFGTLWIWWSDRAILWWTNSPELLITISMIKGWLYVLLTSVLLFFLVWYKLKEREKLRRMLENRQLEVHEFLYALSHHLRTPLVTIHGFIEELNLCYLENGASCSSDCTAAIKHIRYAAAQMDSILKDLSRLHRALRDIPRKQKIEVSSVIRRLWERLCKQESGERVVRFVINGHGKVYVDLR